jgi:glutathione S-transferase
MQACLSSEWDGDDMTIIMYERVGLEGRRPSPFSWRTRYALAHKGADVEYRPTRFADVDIIKQLSGQHFVPIIVDGPKVVHDSWHIAAYLDNRFPDKPTLLGDETARSLARFVNHWSDTVLAPIVRRLIYSDFIWCLAPGDRDYFRSSREKVLGQTLEAAGADRPRWQADFDAACVPLERHLSDSRFIAGAQARYSDYIVFSVLQWARLGSPHDVVKRDTALAEWRARMVALFDGLGDRFPAYPLSQRG